MRHRPFFLKSRWVGWGCVFGGFTIAAYATTNVVLYLTRGEAIPPLLGEDHMAFSTAVSFAIVGFLFAGLGLDKIVVSEEKGDSFKAYQVLLLILASVGSIGAIMVALILAPGAVASTVSIAVVIAGFVNQDYQSMRHRRWAEEERQRIADEQKAQIAENTEMTRAAITVSNNTNAKLAAMAMGQVEQIDRIEATGKDTSERIKDLQK